MYVLRLLGGVSIEGPEGPLTGRIAHRPRLAMLALLTAAGPKGVTREKLAGFLWPDSDEERARHQVSDSVYVIREALGSAAVRTVGEVLHLDHEVVRSDLLAFESSIKSGELIQAVEVYGGPFLDGFFVDGASEFERWVDSERHRLANAYEEAVDTLADAAEAEGDYRKAGQWWQKLIRHDPYNSRAIHRLVKALTFAGDPANALRLASEHRSLLERDLGIEIPSELQELIERVREGAPLDEEARAGRGERAVAPLPPRKALPERGTEVERPAFGLHRARAAFIRIAVTAVAVTSSAVYFTSNWSDSRPPSRTPDVGSLSIAVLPLRNLSPDPGDSYLGDGLTGEIINRLSRVSDLRVISRTSTTKYAETRMTIREIGGELGVARILEGQVQRVGKRVRISVQLIDVETDEHLWSGQYDRDLIDLLDLQSEIARQLAAALVVALKPEELALVAAKPTTNPQAYEYFIRARAVLAQTTSDLDTLEALLDRAVEADPEFAEAWAMLAETRSFRVSNDWPPWSIAASEYALQRARELGPDLPETQRAEGAHAYRISNNYAKALEHFAAVLRMEPSDAWTYQFVGYIRARQGRLEEAVTSIEKALELDPRNPHHARAIGDFSVFLRKYDQAERAFDRTLWVDSAYTSGYRGKALLALLSDGDTARALEVLQEGSRRVGLPEMVIPFVRTGMYFPVMRISLAFFEEALNDSEVVKLLDRECVPCLLDLRFQIAERRAEFDRARSFADSAVAFFEDQLGDSIDAAPTFPHVWRFLGYHSAQAGHRVRAITAAERAVEMMPDSVSFNGNAQFRVTLAEVYAMVEEHDRAIEELESLLAQPSALSVNLLKLDPIWDSLRDYPRFQALLEKYQ